MRCGRAGRCSISQTFSSTSRVASSASASPAWTASARAWMVRYPGDSPPAPAPAGAACTGLRGEPVAAAAARPVTSSAMPWSRSRFRYSVGRRLRLPDRRACRSRAGALRLAEQAPAGPAHRQRGCPRAAAWRAPGRARGWRRRGVLSLRSLAAASRARISLTPGAAASGACSWRSSHGELDGGQGAPGALAGVHDALAVGQLVRGHAEQERAPAGGDLLGLRVPDLEVALAAAGVLADVGDLCFRAGGVPGFGGPVGVADDDLGQVRADHAAAGLLLGGPLRGQDQADRRSCAAWRPGTPGSPRTRERWRPPRPPRRPSGRRPGRPGSAGTRCARSGRAWRTAR